MGEAPTPDRLMNLGLGFWGSKVLLSAVELGVFTELAKAPLGAEALAERLRLHPRGARDFFDALVALDMLERHDGRYENAPDTELFLDRTKPSYLGGMLEMANARLYPFWGSLTEALRTGRPQNEIKKGEDLFTALYANPARLKPFLQATTGLSMGLSIAMAQKFPWRDYRTFVDLGTAQGGLPVQLALAHSHLTGIGYDLPRVRPIFEEYVSSFGLEKRLRFESGDFFANPFPKGDVFVMGHVLHDWNLDEKRRLISKAYEALSDRGALIVFDAVIDDDRRRNAFGLLMSLNMLIETQGGFDYTGADCRAWMTSVGFRRTSVEHLAGPDSMVVGFK